MFYSDYSLIYSWEQFIHCRVLISEGGRKQAFLFGNAQV